MPDSNVRWLVNQHSPLPKIFQGGTKTLLIALSNIYAARLVFDDINQYLRMWL